MAYISSERFLAIAKVEPTEVRPTEQRRGFSAGYQEKAKAAWQKSKQFTAEIKKVSQWCDWKIPPSNSIFFGKAGLGRGKTTRLRNWVRSWQEEGNGFICLGYRNTLLIQLCEKLGFYHLHETDSAIMRHDPSGGIALCVDSLWRFRPEEFDGKILILDEVMNVIRHLLHSPTVKGRDNILELFQEALQRASQVICLDGCLADWAVTYLHQLAPDKKIIRAENAFQGDKPQINFLLGTVDEEEVRKNDRSPWLHYLLNDSPVPAICADSQVFIESLDNLLCSQGLKTLRIDSKTVSEEAVREFIKDCDAYIEQYRPDAILYTPAAESGLDVSIQDHFTHHFAFFFGVLGVDAILQMLGRIRDAKCTKFVWVREWVAQSEQTHSKSPFTQKVGQAIEQMLQADITDTVSGIERDQDIISKLWAIIQGSKNPHFEASNQIQAIALESCKTPTEFNLVVEDYSQNQIEAAIAIQDTHPDRQRLQTWLNEQRLLDTVKIYGEMLVEAVDFGVGAIKAILNPWSIEERWGAILEFEQLAPEKMERLMAIAPNWFELCDG